MKTEKLNKKRKSINLDNRLTEQIRYIEIKYPVRFFIGLVFILLTIFILIVHAIASDQTQPKNNIEGTDHSFVFNLILAFILVNVYFFVRLRYNPITGFSGWRLDA